MTAHVKTHTQEQGKGPTWEAFKLRCLKDFAPRDQKVTETSSIFGICPGSHGNDAITNWFDAKLSDMLRDLKSTLEKENPLFIAALWQQCVTSLFKKARAAKSGHALDHVDHLAKVENVSWPEGKGPPTLPHKPRSFHCSKPTCPNRTARSWCAVQGTQPTLFVVVVVLTRKRPAKFATAKRRRAPSGRPGTLFSRRTNQHFQKFKKRTEKFSATSIVAVQR